MREAVWALLSVALLVGGLAPNAAASHSEDDRCTTVHYAVNEDLAGAFSSCLGDNQAPQPGPLPDQPGPDLPIPDVQGYGMSDHTCPEYGIVLSSPDGEEWLCVEIEYKVPSSGGYEGPSPSISGAELGDCPEQAVGGVVVELGEGRYGACLVVVYEPWDMSPIVPTLDLDIVACEIPGEEGVDPALRIGGGGIAFCLVPILEPGPFLDPGELPSVDDDPASVDTEPCRPRATDPTVYILDGYVRFCVDAGSGDY